MYLNIARHSHSFRPKYFLNRGNRMWAKNAAKITTKNTTLVKYVWASKILAVMPVHKLARPVVLK